MSLFLLDFFSSLPATTWDFSPQKSWQKFNQKSKRENVGNHGAFLYFAGLENHVTAGVPWVVRVLVHTLNGSQSTVTHESRTQSAAEPPWSQTEEGAPEHTHRHDHLDKYRGRLNNWQNYAEVLFERAAYWPWRELRGGHQSWAQPCGSSHCCKAGAAGQLGSTLQRRRQPWGRHHHLPRS